MAEDISALITKLTHKDGLIREAARLSLVDIGQPAVLPLIELLSNKHEQVRWEAINALSEISDPSSAHALVRCLEDKVFEIRWMAAQGLIKIGIDGLVPALKAILLTRKPDWLWDGVRHIVHDLAKDDLEELLLPLKAAFDDVDYHIKVPIEARRTLDKMGILPGEM